MTTWLMAVASAGALVALVGVGTRLRRHDADHHRPAADELTSPWTVVLITPLVGGVLLVAAETQFDLVLKAMQMANVDVADTLHLAVILGLAAATVAATAVGGTVQWVRRSVAHGRSHRIRSTFADAPLPATA